MAGWRRRRRRAGRVGWLELPAALVACQPAAGCSELLAASQPRSTKEMIEPCLLCLHIISSVWTSQHRSLPAAQPPSLPASQPPSLPASQPLSCEAWAWTLQPPSLAAALSCSSSVPSAQPPNRIPGPAGRAVSLDGLRCDGAGFKRDCHPARGRKCTLTLHLPARPC